MAEARAIVCHINGQDQTLREGTTLLGFLESKDVPIQAIVVEHNGKVLPKGRYEGIVLSDGDTLEIIQIIGGG